MGFATHLIKGASFALSAAVAALAGILFANHQAIVTPTSTGFLLSANLVIWTAVGGRYHVIGPLLGAVLIGYLSSELRSSFQYWEVMLALLFIVVVLKAPGGIAEIVAGVVRRWWKKKPAAISSFSAAPETRAQKEHSEIQFNDMHVKIGPVRILNGVQFTAPASGIVCIIGLKQRGHANCPLSYS